MLIKWKKLLEHSWNVYFRGMQIRNMRSLRIALLACSELQPLFGISLSLFSCISCFYDCRNLRNQRFELKINHNIQIPLSFRYLWILFKTIYELDYEQVFAWIQGFKLSQLIKFAMFLLIMVRNFLWIFIGLIYIILTLVGEWINKRYPYRVDQYVISSMFSCGCVARLVIDSSYLIYIYFNFVLITSHFLFKFNYQLICAHSFML